MQSTHASTNINPLWLSRAAKRYLPGARAAWSVLDEICAQLRFGQLEFLAFRGSLAASCGLSTRTLDRAKNELARLGFLSWEQTRVPGQRGPRRGPNRYYVHLVKIWEWVQHQRSATRSIEGEELELPKQEVIPVCEHHPEEVEQAVSEEVGEIADEISDEERETVSRRLSELIASLQAEPTTPNPSAMTSSMTHLPPRKKPRVKTAMGPPSQRDQRAPEPPPKLAKSPPSMLSRILDGALGRQAVQDAYALFKSDRAVRAVNTVNSDSKRRS